jgi:hypothetical protein
MNQEKQLHAVSEGRREHPDVRRSGPATGANKVGGVLVSNAN